MLTTDTLVTSVKDDEKAVDYRLQFRASLTGLVETLQQFNFETGIVANLTQGATQLAASIANARVGLSQAAANVSLDADTGIGAAFAPLVKELGGLVEGAFDKIDFGSGDGTGGTPTPEIN